MCPLVWTQCLQFCGVLIYLWIYVIISLVHLYLVKVFSIFPMCLLVQLYIVLSSIFNLVSSLLCTWACIQLVLSFCLFPVSLCPVPIFGFLFSCVCLVTVSCSSSLCVSVFVYLFVPVSICMSQSESLCPCISSCFMLTVPCLMCIMFRFASHASLVIFCSDMLR